MNVCTQKGVSLIEMLASLLVVSVLMVQVSHVFVMFFKTIFSYQVAVEAQENINSSTFFLAYFLPYAGHIGLQQELRYAVGEMMPDDKFPEHGDFKLYEYIKGLDNVSNIRNVKKHTDVLMFRFYTPLLGVLRDCKNSILSVDSLVQIDFYIDRDNQLRCRGKADASHRRTSAVLATHIDDFQVTYAYREKNQTITFCDAECVSKQGAWTRVIAVRVHMTMATGSSQGVEMATSYVLPHVK